MILTTGRADGRTVTAGTEALGITGPMSKHQPCSVYETNHCDLQVLDLTAETYLANGATIDLDVLDVLELAALQPQRRRRKRQRHQEQVRKLQVGSPKPRKHAPCMHKLFQ